MYNIPAAQQKNYYSIDNFLGVDFTSSPIEVDKRRSPNAINMINNNGFNETRNGYEIVETFSSKINGIWNIDINNKEIILVHAGTELYKCSSDFSTKTLVMSNLNNDKSVGLYFNGYLVIFDGLRALLCSIVSNDLVVSYIDESGYIPTTSIARDSSGGGTDYEKINLMSPYRINTFLTEMVQTTINGEIQNNPQTVFKLDDSNITSVELVEVLQDNGSWQVISPNNYSVDLVTGTVTFATAPGDSPVLGRDNVSIRYRKDSTENKNRINKCNIATLFGYDGNNNRIFVTGNPEFPNWDFHCEQDDPTYWPDENFTKIGTEPIIGYLRLSNGSLSIHKKQSDTDCTVYYRTSNMLDNQEVFPLKSGVKNVGCISKYCNCNLENDPLFLSDQGVYACIGDNDEKYAQQRSYYVNGKLKKEENLENAVAISFLGKYYLAINNHVYIADNRYKSYPKNANTEQYQYEWWYWENLPVRVFFSWNSELYFGTDDGKLCKFNNKYLDDNKEVFSYWETPFLELNNPYLAKTIKNVTLTLNPNHSSDITFGYKLDDETTEIISKNYHCLDDDFPKTIQEKEKIKKFMFIKFFMKNKSTSKMTFERLILEYIVAGKYRGE